MAEAFDELAVIAEPISDEDKVVYLLTGLPESYDVHWKVGWTLYPVLFRHLNEQSMRKLVKKELVSQLDYDASGEIGICEACIRGKQCKNSFKPSETMTSMPLELVHSDVCGNMGQKSIGGVEYFLTLLDNKTHYTWVYPLKTKTRCSNASRYGRQRWRTSLGKG